MVQITIAHNFQNDSNIRETKSDGECDMLLITQIRTRI